VSRADFEAWARGERIDLTLADVTNGPVYAFPETELALEAWQAAERAAVRHIAQLLFVEPHQGEGYAALQAQRNIALIRSAYPEHFEVE
jgi:hypothetical protein